MGLTDFGGGVIDPRMLAFLGNLPGTLQGLQANTASDAQEQALAQEMEQRTRAATEAASQATNAYSQAAQAPMPQQSPGDIGIPRLLGGVASVISGNPAYQAQGEHDIQQQHMNMLQARIQNLQSLRDIYEMRARQAESAGNLEQAEKTRLLQRKMIDEQHQLTAQYGLEGQYMRGKAMNEAAQIRAEAMTEAARIRAGATTGAATIRANAPRPGTTGTAGGYPDYFNGLMGTTRNGTKWFDTSNLPNDKNVKGAALQFAKDNGAVIADKGTSERFHAAEETYKNFDDMEDVLKRILPSTASGRLQSVPTNLMKQATQSDPDVAAFGNFQLAAIRNVQALAAGMGSGFRLNESEIKRIVANMPKITDDLPTGIQKLNWERTFLKNKELSFQKTGGKAIGPPPTGPTADPLGIR